MAMWKIRTKKGKLISENDAKWSEIKDDIDTMAMTTKDGKYIFLPPHMEKYIQFKSASANMDGGNVQLESRVIGFKLGNNTIRVRLDEETGNISIEVE